MLHDSRLVVVGAGANLGDRVATLCAAFGHIARTHGIELCAVSRLYETTPVGGPPQGDFVNAAVALRSVIPPHGLLEALLRIEWALGRRRTFRNAPRPVDLDILWIEGETVDDAVLSVPHPRLHERRFALVPLLEICPYAIDPRTGCPISELLARLPLPPDGAEVRPMPEITLSPSEFAPDGSETPIPGLARLDS